MDNYINLGTTAIKVSHIGVGIMQWGNIKFDEQQSSPDKNVLGIYQASLDAGVTFFDTAEMYGRGKSELHLGKCVKLFPRELSVATKFMPFPWRLSKGELRRALTRSLNRLGLSHVDLYQMHWPFPPVPISSWMDAMADLVADGLIRAVGVSNYSPSQTRLAFDTLAKHNIPLASNQVRYSLLNRHLEKSGLVDLCRQLAVTVIAYSPLEKGVLTGKYTPEKIPAGARGLRYNREYLMKIAPLVDLLQQLGLAHDGKTTPQVALNWLVCKGAVPIPGARNITQAKENAGGFGWQLTTEEVERLDKICVEIEMN